MHKKLASLFTTLFLVATLAACGGKSDDAAKTADASAYKSDSGILRYVPADTPYVYARQARMPAAVREKTGAIFGEMFLAAVRAGIEEEMNVASSDDPARDPDEARRAANVMRAISDMLDPEKLEDTGIHLDAVSAYYGVGLLPVGRIEVHDRGKLEAAIVRLEEAAEVKMESASIGGLDYRFAGDDEARIIMAISDEHLVLAFVPTSLSEAGLRSVLGLDLPASNVADAGTLADAAAEYGFSAQGAGYFDLEKILATFLDEQEGPNAELLAIMDYDSGELSDVCKKEFRGMVNVMPRVLAGYREVSGERIDSFAIVELREDFAEEMRTLAAVVPGLGKDPGGLFSFGMSLDLLAARTFYENRLNAMEADPYQCEHLQEMQAGFMDGRSALEQPMPPIVHSITGFLAVVDNVEGLDIASQQPPTDIDMSLLLATDNAQGLLAMASLFSPEIAGMNLQPDGKPVEVPLPPMGQPFQSAQVAMNESALGLSVGNDAAGRVTSLISADKGDSSPLMSAHMDVQRYYTFTADMIGMAANEPDSDVSPETAEAMSDAFRKLGESFDRMSYDIVLTERGIEMPSIITLSQ